MFSLFVYKNEILSFVYSVFYNFYLLQPLIPSHNYF